MTASPIATDSLTAQIEALKPWLMRHEVQPGMFTPVAPGCAQAVQPEYDAERAAWLFNALKALDGQGVRGRSVLDVGGASGYMLLETLKRGAAEGDNIDGRELHTTQGRFLAQVQGIADRARYTTMLFREFADAWKQPADIVLFMDTVQIVPDPIGFMQTLYGLTRHALILLNPLYRPPVPVPLSRRGVERQSLLMLRTENGTTHNKKGLDPLVVTPTYEAVLEMLWQLDGAQIFQLIPPARWKHPSLPLGQFARGLRTAFIVLRRPVADLPAEARDIMLEIPRASVPPAEIFFPELTPNLPPAGNTLRRKIGRKIIALGQRISGDN